ncbi:MAG: glucosaminidase domain-containing protein [Anaerolineales bacterium]|nr:glucosaminidase domain-containing protein [Anaerolineales bacterium]
MMIKKESLRWSWSLILFICILVMTGLCCSEGDQEQIETAAAQAAKTAISEGKSIAETQAIQLKKTAQAQLATQIVVISTQIAQTTPEPWDTSWLPSDTQYITGRIDKILSGTGLDGKGEEILKNSNEYGVNPAFALAMFRKEAIFAKVNTRAFENKNPGNIIATGDCRGLPNGSSCNGFYGEISTDGRFGIYDNMNNGIKAYFSLLNNEYKPGTSRDCSDIACIITVYCPPSDCDTATYISQITTWTQEYQEQILEP